MEDSPIRTVEDLSVLNSPEGYGSSLGPIIGALMLIIGISVYVALGSIIALIVAVLGAVILLVSSLALWSLHRKLIQE
jgi:hypothetical protein